MEISIGDFVLSGGELLPQLSPMQCQADTWSNVDEQSALSDSFRTIFLLLLSIPDLLILEGGKYRCTSVRACGRDRKMEA